MKNLNIFILAAGKGTRMNSTLPKILHSIAGKPMVNHVIDQAKKLNPKKIYLIVNKELSNRKDLIFPDVEIVIQKNQNGTADAIKSCLPKIKKTSGNALILYADLPLIELSSMRKALKNVTKKNINLLTFISDEKNSYGKVIFDNKRNVSEVIEQNELGKGEHHQVCNSGIFSCDLDILKKLIPKINNKTNKKKEYYLTDIFKLAYHDNVDTKSILVNEDEFMGVNNKKELAVAEYIAQSKLREKFLIKGVTLVDPETVYFSEDTKIDKDVVIYPNVFIGKNVRIGKGSKILSFSHLEDCSVGKDVTIGPFARLRPGADIKDEVKVGNFVEIKKSKIDKNSKVNHLTYIGDTEIGKDVNIGAGTITCNYDGKNKFKTIIEDGAFIGSNSSLIAPVKIGKNAYVGSGSAISKNIKEKALGIERTNQIEIKNWHRKIKKK